MTIPETLAGKTVFVTGATGFLGGALVERLSQEGAQIRALARRPERADPIRDFPNLEVVTGDVTNMTRMREITVGCDYVFHLAAATSGTLELQQAVNVNGTEHVATAAAEAGVKRFVLVSSIASYGYGVQGRVAEEQEQSPRRVPYNITKAKGEQALRTVAQQHHLSYSILRPGMIFGPRSGAWTDTMFKLAKRRPMPFIGDGTGTCYPIFVDDVVDLLLVMALHPAAEGEAFNAVLDPAPTWREFLGRYMQLAGHDRWLAIPVPLVQVLAPLVDTGALVIRGEPLNIRDLVHFLTGQQTYSMDKARERLGWQARFSLEEGIQRCVPYLEEKGLL